MRKILGSTNRIEIKIINWLMIIIALMPTMAFGESQEYSYEKYYSENMTGWKGIVFICSFDSSDEVLKRICQRAITDIELLAASNKVNLKIAGANRFEEAELLAAVNRFVTLEYKLLATREGGQFDAKAVHAQLAFESFYSNAVEKDSNINSIHSIPRSGDLELWSRTAIGFGSPTDIVEPFSDGAETLIKKAFTLFIKYAK